MKGSLEKVKEYLKDIKEVSINITPILYGISGILCLTSGLTEDQVTYLGIALSVSAVIDINSIITIYRKNRE